MHVTLISPGLIHQKGDPFGGIPAMPSGLAYLAGWLRHKDIEVTLIDAYGDAPLKAASFREKYVVRGLSLDEIIAQIPAETNLVGVGVHSGSQHHRSLEVINAVKERLGLPVVVGGHHPTVLYREFLQKGADYVILNEGEIGLEKLCYALQGEIPFEQVPGLAWRGGGPNPQELISDLDIIPFPANELLPLDNYWKLGLGHGPVNGDRPHVFMISSRGCPYGCRFCTTPGISKRKWRPRSAENIVDEFEYWAKNHKVTDFHFQDENFAVDKKRVKEMCRIVKDRGLDIRITLPSGIKVDTIDEETVIELESAGCRYICLAPESGSQRVLKLMNKPLDYEHLLRILKLCDKINVKTGSFFIIGFPGENDDDRRQTMDLLTRMTRAGGDDFSIFIMSPLPGAAAWEVSGGPEREWVDYEQLCWSPRWRKDYKMLNKWRRRMYYRYLFTKIFFQPFKVMKHAWNILRGKFETKGEMTVSRMLRTSFAASDKNDKKDS